MSAGHRHSRRPRRPTHQTRDVDLTQLDGMAAARALDRAQRRMVRLERRRAQVAAGPQPAVVVLPIARARPSGMRRAAAGTTGPSRWVREALVRQALAAAEAARRG